ncbi:SHC-transforming protein 1-like isoform X1 [Planococcus citri]|uniref:SHC-transforming protein 1-like isoform X1 n=1 Tax=Planococcus citri TaxID=170843 RepID=UPI0031F95D0A
MPDSAGPSGNFLHKPVRGWLHPDQTIMKKGVTYAVRYIGCLDVNTSMKSLDFDSRFQIAKECINRVCEAACLKTVDRKRKIDKRVSKAIGDRPNMLHAGSNVKLSISSSCLALKLLDNDTSIAMHDMPRISFASGGDADTLDFVAYVAKDANNWRACFVLECGGGLAQDVITTIGQAFDLRFKQFLNRPMIEPMTRDERDREYYNDMPGKVPPDVGPPPVPPLPNINRNNISPEPRERLPSTNLIDLNCEVVAPPPSQSRIHEYINDIVLNDPKTSQPRDVFDMQPFISNDMTNSNSRLHEENWFHGSIGRQQAEALLKQDGDFLVRESQGSPGQYVLTGIQGGIKKHLLLIDPEGVVRTKDRMFESVSHLINYHCQNKLPIISAESALILRNPIHRK